MNDPEHNIGSPPAEELPRQNWVARLAKEISDYRDRITMVTGHQALGIKKFQLNHFIHYLTLIAPNQSLDQESLADVCRSIFSDIESNISTTAYLGRIEELGQYHSIDMSSLTKLPLSPLYWILSARRQLSTVQSPDALTLYEYIGKVAEKMAASHDLDFQKIEADPNSESAFTLEASIYQRWKKFAERITAAANDILAGEPLEPKKFNQFASMTGVIFREEEWVDI